MLCAFLISRRSPKAHAAEKAQLRVVDKEFMSAKRTVSDNVADPLVRDHVSFILRQSVPTAIVLACDGRRRTFARPNKSKDGAKCVVSA
jgi:hypothetical protein